MLCDLSIEGMWSAQKLDRTITAEVAAKHNLVGSPGKYTKELFPSSTCGKPNPHTRWGTACYEVRKYWRAHTSPWEDGRRVVSAKFTPTFGNQMNALAEEATAALERFIEWLPEGQRLAELPDGLNGLFNFGDYLSQHQLRDGFKVRFRLYPIPQAHHYITNLAGQAISDARAALNAENEQRLAHARQSIWLEALAPVENMASILANPGSRIHSSLVANVIEVANRIPALDFDNNPQLGQLRERLLQLTSGITSDALVSDADLRREIGGAAAALVASFGKFGRKLEV